MAGGGTRWALRFLQTKSFWDSINSTGAHGHHWHGTVPTQIPAGSDALAVRNCRVWEIEPPPGEGKKVPSALCGAGAQLSCAGIAFPVVWKAHPGSGHLSWPLLCSGPASAKSSWPGLRCLQGVFGSGLTLPVSMATSTSLCRCSSRLFMFMDLLSVNLKQLLL